MRLKFDRRRLTIFHNTPLGVATYRDSKDVPEEYKSLKPLLEGAQRLLEEESVEYL